jgi:hypothetical protein
MIISKKIEGFQDYHSNRFESIRQRNSILNFECHNLLKIIEAFSKSKLFQYFFTLNSTFGFLFLKPKKLFLIRTNECLKSSISFDCNSNNRKSYPIEPNPYTALNNFISF